MNTFVISALIATVTAEAGYECKQPDTAWEVLTVTAVTDADDEDACEAACKITAEDDGNDGKDYCCSAKTTAAYDGDDAEFECTLWSLDTVADVTIKDDKAATEDPDVKYAAWMWNAGVAADDLEGSATMISSAIATIAAVAMIAY